MIKLNICDKHTLFCYLSLLMRRDSNVPGTEIHLYKTVVEANIHVKQFVWIEFMNCILVLQDHMWFENERKDRYYNFNNFLTLAGEKNIESNCFLFWFSYCISILNRSPQTNKKERETVRWKELWFVISLEWKPIKLLLHSSTR